MSDPKDESSPLENLRERLYDPNARDPFAVPVLTHRAPEKIEGWQAPAPEAPKKVKKNGLSLSLKFLIGTGVFFFLAICVAAYIFFFGARSVSTNNIVISAQGPTSIASGDTVPLAITIENKNPVDITSAALSVDFPDGTRSADDKVTPLARYSDTLDSIPAGQTGTRTVSAVLFGNEGQKVSIPIELDYHVPGSNSVFVKKITYEFTITTSPVSISASSVSQVPSGQRFSLQVTVHSNATAPLQNVAVLANYPSGFVPVNASSTGPLFALGTLAPGEEKQVTIAGSIIGQDGDERVFTFTSGTQPDTSAKQLAVSYNTTKTDVTLTKPFLVTTLTIDGDGSDTPVIRTGTLADAELSWVNALATQLTEGQITVSIKGSVLDTNSIKSVGGYYRSSDTSVLFDKSTYPGLASLNPGDTGAGSFTFATKDGAALAKAGVKNPTVQLSISLAGKRAGQGNVPETLSSTVTRTVQVGTDLTLTSRAVHSTGPFTNSGPWPPAVDKETTYTIYYTLANTVNSVGGATVTATLPSYVRYTGMTSPSDGSLIYNDATRTLTWNAGDIAAGTGYGGAPAREIAFQVALLPSLSQKGTSPILITTQTLGGVDRFTKKQLTGTAHDINTNVTQDPDFKNGYQSVTQ